MTGATRQHLLWFLEDPDKEVNAGLPYDVCDNGKPDPEGRYPGIVHAPFIRATPKNGIVYLTTKDEHALMEWMFAHGHITEHDMVEYTLSLMEG